MNPLKGIVAIEALTLKGTSAAASGQNRLAQYGEKMQAILY